MEKGRLGSAAGVSSPGQEPEGTRRPFSPTEGPSSGHISSAEELTAAFQTFKQDTSPVTQLTVGTQLRGSRHATLSYKSITVTASLGPISPYPIMEARPHFVTKIYDSTPVAQDSWMDTEFIRILSHANQFIGEFPLSFVQRGGVNKWSYVWDVVDQLVEPENRGSIKDHNGELMRHEDQPVAGTYFLEPESESSELHHDRFACQQSDGVLPVSFARGPEYFRKYVAPDLDEGQSSRSRSKSRSSVNQNRFRIAVGVRDGQCLITDVDYESCTACHIVPQSREDLYQRILSLPPRAPPIFQPSSGLLLEDALHRAWDRLEISFYFREGIYYVHFFNLALPGALNHHGKAIPPSRFRSGRDKHPNPRTQMVRFVLRSSTAAVAMVTDEALRANHPAGRPSAIWNHPEPTEWRHTPSRHLIRRFQVDLAKHRQAQGLLARPDTSWL
ncbi:hypothetical protein EHS25_004789 [Saitozyma podzolica]|uniref:HNH nuclease domain-containing protein n=1 Tax=Saitozyma podzolica TaxID=1890683 RepID=A0A427Y2Y1_9TREE|nr:hypothetical protein EHS25_004789 [Saitozyma podzolica]